MTEAQRCTVAGVTEGEGVSEECADLARSPSILDELARDLDHVGLLEDRIPAAQLVYLAVVSRLHARPVSIVVKGSSSAGKSWMVAQVLEFFGPEAYHALTATSEKALVYDTTSVRHRTLVVYEAAGIAGEHAAGFLRTLLSEGCLRYQTVTSGPNGPQEKFIEREGPTGLLSTTTALALHPEDETRLLSIMLPEGPEQTRAVLLRWGAAAAGGETVEVDRSRWHELDRWLATGEREVVVSYGAELAGLLPAGAPRLARDFINLLTLIKTHALLHRASRERDDQGRIIATLADYGAVRELVEPILAAGLEATVKSEVRELVQVVAEESDRWRSGVPQSAVVGRLAINKGAVSRRVGEAVRAGYLVNDEQRRGRPARLLLGDPLPDDGKVLPLPDEVQVAVSVTPATVQPHDEEEW